MKTQIILALVVVFLFGVYSFSIYELGKSKAKTQIIRDTDTVITYRTIKDIQVIPKYTTIYKTDSVKITDTLFVFDTSYVATLDTTYEDDTAKLKVDFVSPIPLSKKSYFNLDLEVKKELVFVPTYKKEEPSWWYKRFGCFIGGGVGYDTNTKQVNPQVGIYFGFNLF